MSNKRKGKWLVVSTLAGLLLVGGAGAASAERDRALGSCDGIQLVFNFLYPKWRPGTVNDNMQSWIGAKLPEMVGKWGAPSAMFENRDGTRIVSWKDVGSYSGVCTKTFEVDGQDLLTRWGTSGDCGCAYSGGLHNGLKELRSTPIPRMTL